MLRTEIALALGISPDTLLKHYETELTVVALQRRMEALQGAHAAARRGQSAAVRLYLAAPVDDGLTAPPKAPDQPAQPAVPAPAPRPLGKKEQAKVDAVGAEKGTAWDGLLDPAPPPNTPLQ
jgi:hypothetical protein